MIRWRLQRLSILEAGAFGVLMDATEELWPFAVTLEPTYEALRVKIPPGLYVCRRTIFYRGKPKPYETFEIVVPGHDMIKFHRGNIEPETDGCPLVGARFGTLYGNKAVLQSKEGFAELMLRAGGAQELTLEVRNPA